MLQCMFTYVSFTCESRSLPTLKHDFGRRQLVVPKQVEEPLASWPGRRTPIKTVRESLTVRGLDLPKHPKTSQDIPTLWGLDHRIWIWALGPCRLSPLPSWETPLSASLAPSPAPWCPRCPRGAPAAASWAPDNGRGHDWRWAGWRAAAPMTQQAVRLRVLQYSNGFVSNSGMYPHGENEAIESSEI